MLLNQKTETFVAGENHSWLGSAHATDTWDSITLDGDQFLTAFPTGVVPSGVVLAKRTSDSLYIPYVDATVLVGTVTRTATAGTYRLIADGLTTPVDLDASAAGTAAALQTAIRNLGDKFAAVTVSGSAGGPYTVTFVGIDEVIDVAIDDGEATGGTVVWATTTAGGTETPAGEGAAVGFLATTKDLGGITAATVGNTPAALMWHGQVIVAKLPASSGFSSAARRDLVALGISFVG